MALSPKEIRSLTEINAKIQGQNYKTDISHELGAYTDATFVKRGAFDLAVCFDDTSFRGLMHAANELLQHVPSSNSKLRGKFHQLIRFSALRYAFSELDSVESENSKFPQVHIVSTTRSLPLKTEIQALILKLEQGERNGIESQLLGYKGCSLQPSCPLAGLWKDFIKWMVEDMSQYMNILWPKDEVRGPQ